MKNGLTIKQQDVSTAVFPGGRLATKSSRLTDYWELTKPRLTFLVLITTLVGFCMGSSASLDWILLFHAMIGTALVAGGAAVLNQFLERDLDARMDRTEDRPIPSGRLPAGDALLFGAVLSVAGLLYLVVAVNLLTSFLAAITLGMYLFVYTPLKKKTPLCTTVGAFPGATPPLIGWAAVSGTLDAEAWILFAILFFWQMPHFYALAQMYRDDYARAGLPILTVVDPDGFRTGMQIVSHTLLLLPASLAPAFFGMTGMLYFWVALFLSLGFLGFGLHAAFSRTVAGSRRLFLASIFYLPSLLMLMVADKVAP